MSGCPPVVFRNKRPDVGQLGAAVSALGVPEKDAIHLETALRTAAQGSPILSYELEDLPDGSTRFTVIIGPPA